ncbi:hypothetical protein Nmel_008564 [Mimus melanotis]
MDVGDGRAEGSWDTLTPNVEGTGGWMDLEYRIHPCWGWEAAGRTCPLHDLLCLSPKSPQLLPWQSDVSMSQGMENVVTVPIMKEEEAKLVVDSFWQRMEPCSPHLGSPKGGLGPKVRGVGLAGEQHQPWCWGLADPQAAVRALPTASSEAQPVPAALPLTLGARQCPQARPQVGTALGQGHPCQGQAAEEGGWQP